MIQPNLSQEQKCGGTGSMGWGQLSGECEAAVHAGKRNQEMPELLFASGCWMEKGVRGESRV